MIICKICNENAEEIAESIDDAEVGYCAEHSTSGIEYKSNN